MTVEGQEKFSMRDFYTWMHTTQEGRRYMYHNLMMEFAQNDTEHTNGTIIASDLSTRLRETEDNSE